MKFSVILPIYNVEKYLSECVESILKQTFKDYEIILVDDGSTDSSPAICDEYAEKYDFINVIHKTNSGQSDARNRGTEAAKGDYIVYIDSDDFIVTDKFFSDVNEKTSSCPDIVMYKYVKYFDDTKKYGKCAFSYAAAERETAYADKIKALVVSGAYHGMAWIKAVKRELIVNNGIEFASGIVCEDIDWNYKVVSSAASVEFADDVYIAYRQRPNSVTSGAKLKNLTDLIFIMEKWTKIIDGESENEKLKSALMGSLADNIGNLLILYSRIKDKEKKRYKKAIKGLLTYLEYSATKRPRTINGFYKLFGFDVTVMLLKIKDR